MLPLAEVTSVSVIEVGSLREIAFDAVAVTLDTSSPAVMLPVLAFSVALVAVRSTRLSESVILPSAEIVMELPTALREPRSTSRLFLVVTMIVPTVLATFVAISFPSARMLMVPLALTDTRSTAALVESLPRSWMSMVAAFVTVIDCAEVSSAMSPAEENVAAFVTTLALTPSRFVVVSI